jgi:hypothetical protein
MHQRCHRIADRLRIQISLFSVQKSLAFLRRKARLAGFENRFNEAAVKSP